MTKDSLPCLIKMNQYNYHCNLFITYQQGYSDQLLLRVLHTCQLETPRFPKQNIQKVTLLTTYSLYLTVIAGDQRSQQSQFPGCSYNIHVWHKCNQHSFRLPLRTNGMHTVQSDHTNWTFFHS